MLSKEQHEAKIRKILLTVQSFLEGDFQNLSELSQHIGLSTSSIQRYLKEKKVITEYFGPEIYELVQEKLALNKENGHIKGGFNYHFNNISTKDNNGKFTGSKRK